MDVNQQNVLISVLEIHLSIFLKNTHISKTDAEVVNMYYYTSRIQVHPVWYNIEIYSHCIHAIYIEENWQSLNILAPLPLFLLLKACSEMDGDHIKNWLDQ